MRLIRLGLSGFAVKVRFSRLPGAASTASPLCQTGSEFPVSGSVPRQGESGQILIWLIFFYVLRFCTTLSFLVLQVTPH